MFRHYSVILRELVINTLPSYTSISNAAFSNTYLLHGAEQLTGLQLVKKFPAFHGTRRFITALTSVRHLSLPWASPIQSIYPHPTSWRSHPNIIHPSTPRSPQWSLSLQFPHQDPIQPPILTHTRHIPSPSHSSRFYHPHNIG